MSPSETPNLENRISAVSSGNVAQVSHPSQQFTNCLYPANRQTIPSRHSSGASFSVRALQQLGSTENQPSAAHNYSTLHSQSHPASSHSEPLRREGGDMLTSCYNNHPQGFPLSVCQGIGSNFGANDSSRVLSKTGIPESTASPVTSLEALLDTLSVIQQKIQQLQAVVQLIAHGTTAIPQQQQTLATGIASMISELLVASAGLMQQPPAGSTQISASNPLFNSIIGGTLISRINTSQQGGMGNPLSTLLGSTFENFCAPSRYCSPSLAGMGTNSAMSGGIEGLEMDNSERRDGDLGEQGLVPPPGSSAISLAPIIGTTSGGTVEIKIGVKVSPDRALGVTGNRGMDGVVNQMIHGNEALHSPSAEDHGTGLGLNDDDDEDDGERENLPPDSYELLEMDAAEVLAEHTHFCEICGKGFKRDANLRMHMRGHGDEYKTPAALARPDKSTHALSTVRPRRYSCPFVGCKRNKKHRKFLPLKTVLCVKNHYRRSHCPKMLTCNKCKMKKFSVVADLKTHEKHCGRDKWQCSCGTTFSRKDKLLGHIGLFAGHIPALPLSETESSAGGLETLPYCFNSGHGEGWQGTLCDEAAQLGAAQFTLVHGNEPAINPALIVGSSIQGMDMTDETARGVRAGRSEGLQALGHRRGCTADIRATQDGSSSSSSLASAFVSNSSIFHDLLSKQFSSPS